MKTVLFVCVGNASRSLMAEAIFNSRRPPGWRAVSAGVAPAMSVNPHTEAALATIGVPLPNHPPQLLTEKLVREALVHVSIGALEHPACLITFSKTKPRRWEVADPHYFDEARFRDVRDEIHLRVVALIQELESERRTAQG